MRGSVAGEQVLCHNLTGSCGGMMRRSGWKGIACMRMLNNTRAKRTGIPL